MNTGSDTVPVSGRPPTCVIIPAFEEAAAIGGVIRAVRAQGMDVIVVDDGSTDATAAEAEKATARVLRHAVNRGKGAALETGFRLARAQGYTAVITMDADGQHAPEDIPSFLQAHARTGRPVILGNRMTQASNMPWLRRWTNRFMSWLLGRLLGQDVPDTQCGFRFYCCAILPDQPLTAIRFAAESEILLDLARRKIPISSVPIRTIYAHERSKINPVTDSLRFIGMLLRQRWRRRSRP